MKHLQQLIYMLGILVFLTLGCKKSNVEKPLATIYKANGTIMNTGSTAADGCDWVIVINSVYYHPANLNNKYLVDRAQVTVSYDLLDQKFYFGYLPLSANNSGMSIIHINNIKIN